LPRKTLYYEAGPSWEMVEQWARSYQDSWKRKLRITMGYHEFRNGHSGLFVEVSSWSGGGHHALEHYYATLWYWPNSRFVSLPAMVVGLITAHDKETEALQEKWSRGYVAMPEGELPLFK